MIESGRRSTIWACAWSALPSSAEELHLSRYVVAHLEQIEELSDGREPWRPVRHRLGVTAFGVNAWTGREVGDRIINEHDESEPGSHEELYVVLAGRARFGLDGEPGAG